MAKKGVLMNIETDTVAKPYSNDEARRYFREMVLGIEYRKLQLSNYACWLSRCHYSSQQ